MAEPTGTDEFMHVVACLYSSTRLDYSPQYVRIIRARALSYIPGTPLGSLPAPWLLYQHTSALIVHARTYFRGPISPIRLVKGENVGGRDTYRVPWQEYKRTPVKT